MSTQPARGKTTPASTGGSFAPHAHATPEVVLADQPLQPGVQALDQAAREWKAAHPSHLLAHNEAAVAARAAEIQAALDAGEFAPEPVWPDVAGPTRSPQAQAFVDAGAGSSTGALASHLLQQAEGAAAATPPTSPAPLEGSATQQAIARAAARGIVPGAIVMTDSGEARVVEVGYRGVHVEVLDPGTWTSDSGKVIANDPHRHIMAGTPGYDRIKAVPHPSAQPTRADAIGRDIEDYGEASNVFRPISEVHADYKSRNPDGTWSVLTASKSGGTVLAPHRGPEALDEWYASQAVFGPGRPDAARTAIGTYLEAKAAYEDRPWDDDGRRALARAKRLRAAYSEYGDTFAGH